MNSLSKVKRLIWILLLVSAVFPVAAHADTTVVPIISATSVDAFELDDTAGQARPVTPNSPAQFHTFGVSGDVDWVAFSALVGQVFVISTRRLGADVDTYLTLYDVDGQTVLAENDNVSLTLASRLVWRATDSGVFFIRVHNVRQSFGPDAYYELSVASLNPVNKLVDWPLR